MLFDGDTEKNTQIRAALRQWILDHGADLFVTANFNRDTNSEAARRNLKRWHARIDRALLGASWAKKAINQRTFFVAFVENTDSNLHYHMLLKLSDPQAKARFLDIAESAWLGLVKSGSLDIKPIETRNDLARTAAYATKQLYRSDRLEQFILSTEFITNNEAM